MKRCNLDFGRSFFDRGDIGELATAVDDRRRVDPAAQDVVDDIAIAVSYDDVKSPLAIGRK